LTPTGVTLIKKAQAKATASDALATASISTQERKTLVRLLKKIYQSN
jgi:DNA-binding MarR family transcriptional regulator